VRRAKRRRQYIPDKESDVPESLYHRPDVCAVCRFAPVPPDRSVCRSCVPGTPPAYAPTDDADPITDDWLRSIGFARFMQSAADNHLTLDAGHVRVTRWLPHQWPHPSWSVCRSDGDPEYLPLVFVNDTRGKVRGLLAALGVPT